jgi:hypothetical protein
MYDFRSSLWDSQDVKEGPWDSRDSQEKQELVFDAGG